MDRYKGSNGTILIIGGSKLYTGSPYFAAKAAFRSGAELIYIFTSKHTLTPLKTLLPEAIITKFPKKNYEWILKRMQVCIFGSGLGRISKSSRIINILNKLACPIIVDGDGLRFFSLNNLIYEKMIATPNFNEVKYVKNFSIVIYKGYKDVIQIKNMKYEINTVHHLKKRIAGQGDILCGIIAAKIVGKGEKNFFEIFRKILIQFRIWGEQAYEMYGEGVIVEDILKLIKYF